jgi:hypothetical protein
MKSTSKEFLEKISSLYYAKSTHYRYNKTILKMSDKYVEGRLTGYDYINELCFYFLQEEKNIPEKFKEQIQKQMQQNTCLNDGDYKDGIYDVLNDVLEEIKNCQ